MRLTVKARFPQDEECAMFRAKDPQLSMFEPSFLLSEEKRQRLEATWAHAFRNHALPLIDEQAFRDLYCPDNGRPNMPVQTIVGILILKDTNDLTDAETLYHVEFDLGWHHALRLTPEQAHCCQKTLHNFRVKLIDNDRARQVFTMITDRILAALGTRTDKQRLDSTHICSNIAILKRLGLFCETIRLFLCDLRRSRPEEWARVPPGLRQRYLKEDGAASHYDDAKASEARRRLAVCGRDLWRLCNRFCNTSAVTKLESYAVLERLFNEQCEVSGTPALPESDDADRDEEPAPVQLKDSKQVASDSLQSPHDPDATYGHKGKGYEVQVSETVGNGAAPEFITDVFLTPACGSDADQVVPVIEALAARGVQPQEMLADTTYGSTANVNRCAELGTELVAPVPGPKVEVAVTPADPAPDAAACSTGEEAPAAVPPAPAPSSTCANTKAAVGARTLDERRRYQATPEFRERYAERAGCEATNSELKRKHGLGRLRVRGAGPVRLAVYFKALACNVKRMLNHLVETLRSLGSATEAEPAVALV